MGHALFHKTLKLLKEEGVRETRISIGISGGLDSTALLHLMSALAGPQKLSVQAVHIHHGVFSAEGSGGGAAAGAGLPSLSSPSCGLPESRFERGGGGARLRGSVFQDSSRRLRGCGPSLDSSFNKGESGDSLSSEARPVEARPAADRKAGGFLMDSMMEESVRDYRERARRLSLELCASLSIPCFCPPPPLYPPSAPADDASAGAALTDDPLTDDPLTDGPLTISRPLTSEADLREFRHSLLERLRREKGAQWTALAHHSGDLLETRLLHLIRGCGEEGFSAMKILDPPFLRPFLDVTREEIKDYALANRLSWAEDPGNKDNRFFRNWLRNQWLPDLERRRPGGVKRLAASFSHVADVLPRRAPPARAGKSLSEKASAAGLARGIAHETAAGTADGTADGSASLAGAGFADGDAAPAIESLVARRRFAEKSLAKKTPEGGAAGGTSASVASHPAEIRFAEKSLAKKTPEGGAAGGTSASVASHPAEIRFAEKSLAKKTPEGGGAGFFERLVRPRGRGRGCLGIDRRLLMEVSLSDRKRVLAFYMRQQKLKNYGAAHIDELLKRLDGRRKNFQFRLLKREWRAEGSWLFILDDEKG